MSTKTRPSILKNSSNSDSDNKLRSPKSSVITKRNTMPQYVIKIAGTGMKTTEILRDMGYPIDHDYHTISNHFTNAHSSAILTRISDSDEAHSTDTSATNDSGKKKLKMREETPSKRVVLVLPSNQQSNESLEMNNSSGSESRCLLNSIKEGKQPDMPSLLTNETSTNTFHSAPSTYYYTQEQLPSMDYDAEIEITTTAENITQSREPLLAEKAVEEVEENSSAVISTSDSPTKILKQPQKNPLRVLRQLSLTTKCKFCKSHDGPQHESPKRVSSRVKSTQLSRNVDSEVEVKSEKLSDNEYTPYTSIASKKVLKPSTKIFPKNLKSILEQDSMELLKDGTKKRKLNVIQDRCAVTCSSFTATNSRYYSSKLGNDLLLENLDPVVRIRKLPMIFAPPSSTEKEKLTKTEILKPSGLDKNDESVESVTHELENKTNVTPKSFDETNCEHKEDKLSRLMAEIFDEPEETDMVTAPIIVPTPIDNSRQSTDNCERCAEQSEIIAKLRRVLMGNYILDHEETIDSVNIQNNKSEKSLIDHLNKKNRQLTEKLRKEEIRSIKFQQDSVIRANRIKELEMKLKCVTNIIKSSEQKVTMTKHDNTDEYEQFEALEDYDE